MFFVNCRFFFSKCPEKGCNQSFHKKKQLVNHKLEEHTDHIVEARKCHR